MLLVGVLSSAILLAQSYTASLRGVVTDASSAALPAARVTVTDTERGVRFETVSDQLGRYATTALPPGNYSLAVEAGGFNRYVRSGITLEVQQQATLDRSTAGRRCFFHG